MTAGNVIKILAALFAIFLLVRVLNPKQMYWEDALGERLPKYFDIAGRAGLGVVAMAGLWHLWRSLAGR